LPIGQEIAAKIAANMDLGQELAQIRKETGLSQKALANMVGCANSSISKIESGVRMPTPAMLSRILKVFARHLEWKESEYQRAVDEFQRKLNSPTIFSSARTRRYEHEPGRLVSEFGEFATIAAATNLIAEVAHRETEKLVVDILAATGGTTLSSILPVILKVTVAPTIEVSLYITNANSPFSSIFPSHWPKETEMVLERLKRGNLASPNAVLRLNVYAYDFVPVFHGVMLNKSHLWLGYFGWRHFSGHVELSGAESPHRYYSRKEHLHAEYFFHIFEDWLESMPCDKVYTFPTE
jgi:transcriptional regulator with XRE-family HTH domain